MERLKLIYKPISELKEYENNPRRNEEAVGKVANSIREFGFKVPIVIDSNDIIVAGHTRVKACYELGITEVPCILADDLTEEQVRAYRLVDNKTAELSQWDYEKLSNEMADIIGLDMTEFGFVSESEYDAMSFLDTFSGEETMSSERASDRMAVTIYFPLDLKSQVDEWLKEHTKDELTEVCLDFMGIERCRSAGHNAYSAMSR